MKTLITSILYFLFLTVSVRFNPFVFVIIGVFTFLFSLNSIRNNKFHRDELNFISFVFLFGLGTGVFSIFNPEYTGIRYSLYILFFLLPCSVSILSISDKISLNKAILTLSLLLFVFYFFGFLSQNRYQQVGNQIAYAGVAIPELTFIFFLILLIVGSRQAMVALIFSAGLKWIGVKRKKWLIIMFFLSFLGLIFYSIKNLIPILLDFAVRFNLVTLVRALYKLNNPETEGRLGIWQNTLERVKWYPQGHPYIYHNDNLPHNLFLESLLVFGFILGTLVIVYLIFIIYKSIKKGNYLILAALIPALLSNGPGAYKYFFLFVILSRFHENSYPKLS